MSILTTVLEKIEARDPQHAAKIRENTGGLGPDYFAMANRFFQKYQRYLEHQGLTLDYGLDRYLRMHEAMIEERTQFIRSGEYSNGSFAEVEKAVYANPEVMEYHMHGLTLAQFLWFDQYERIRFFCDHMLGYFAKGSRYLEVGGGHGLYVNEALELLPLDTTVDLVDISQTSLTLAKGIVDNNRVNYHLKNIFDFSATDIYDFVTIGEVLEHVEDPVKLLGKIGDHMTDTGVCYMTTPINAPMIDHIYLFRNEDEIREMIAAAGFEVVLEKSVISEKVSSKKAALFKIPVMYAAFIRKIG